MSALRRGYGIQHAVSTHTGPDLDCKIHGPAAKESGWLTESRAGRSDDLQVRIGRSRHLTGQSHSQLPTFRASAAEKAQQTG